MAKNFFQNNPLNKLSGEQQEKEDLRPGVPDKKKVGRPKTKDVSGTCKKINIAVPIVLLDKWEDIKIVHGSNLTEYVTKLIQKDMDSNYENYKKIADQLNNVLD